MCGHVCKDKIWNEHKQEKMGIAPIKGEMIENHLRWFAQVQKTPQDAPMRRMEWIILGSVQRGRRKMVENHLRWFGHIQRRLQEAHMRSETGNFQPCREG